MVPFLMFSYIAAAMGFYGVIYKTAPLVNEDATDCQIYELFPAEEIRKAA